MRRMEKEELLEEQRILRVLLDFYVKNRVNVSMEDAEFQTHIDDILDRLNALTRLLAETKD